MVGVGLPSAIQSNDAKFPLMTATSSVVPAPSTPGGTGGENLKAHYWPARHFALKNRMNEYTHREPVDYTVCCRLLLC